MKQNELCKKLEISAAYLSEIESGKKSPSVQLLTKYSETFEIPLSSILFFAENPAGPADIEAARRFVSTKILAMMSFIAQRSEAKS